MRRIALAVLASALTFALAAPAHAEGWSNWIKFASHNGVLLELRGSGHLSPQDDSKFDWRVTNNTTKALYHLWLGQRTYYCTNGYTESFVSSAFSGIEGKELNPGLSAIFSTDNETLDYLGADNIDHASCPEVDYVEFDNGDSHALWLSVEPLEPSRPWTEHSFAANNVFTLACQGTHFCGEYIVNTERTYNTLRDYCQDQTDVAPVESCQINGAYACELWHHDIEYLMKLVDTREIIKAFHYYNDNYVEMFRSVTGYHDYPPSELCFGNFMGRQ